MKRLLFTSSPEAPLRPADKLRAVQVLRAAGLLDLSRPVLTAATSLAMRRLGPISGAAHIAARRDPDDLALVDELGGLSYGELDRRANGLARGWAAAGVEPGHVIGVLCRDHRGGVDSMIACGKLGVRLVLLNTGFSRVQLADVARREGVSQEPQVGCRLSFANSPVSAVRGTIWLARSAS